MIDIFFGNKLKLASLGIITLLALFLFSSPAEGKAVSSTELIEKSRQFNSKKVFFVGEVVGEVMFRKSSRGNFAWLNINDDPYSRQKLGKGKLAGYNSGQSVWISAAQARKVKVAGDYRHRGDIVRVEGIFHRACPDNGGDMAIIGSRLEVLKQGYSVTYPLDDEKLALAVVLFLITSLIFIYRYLLSPRAKLGKMRERRS